MPKFITTQTRIAELGNPRIIIGGGFQGLEVATGLAKSRTQSTPFNKYNQRAFWALSYQAATSALETSSVAFLFRKQFPNTSIFHLRSGKVFVFINWLVRYFTRDRHYRLIIARPEDGV